MHEFGKNTHQLQQLRTGDIQELTARDALAKMENTQITRCGERRLWGSPVRLQRAAGSGGQKLVTPETAVSDLEMTNMGWKPI